MQKDLVRRWLVSALFLLLVLPASAWSTEVVLVALGGYNSCKKSAHFSDESPYGMDMYVRATALAQKISRQGNGTIVHYVYGCLFTSPPPNGEGSFITSEFPNKVQYGSAHDIADSIRHMVKDPATPIFFIGHSYGGWMGMYLDLDLGSAYNVAGLFTLDPISPKTCGPTEVIFGGKGCHQSPRDLDNKQIRNLTPRWLNFYQRQDSWINSSEIKEAAENYLMTYRRAHTKLDQDSRVWEKVTTSVQEALAVSPSTALK